MSETTSEDAPNGFASFKDSDGVQRIVDVRIERLENVTIAKNLTAEAIPAGAAIFLSGGLR